MTKAIVHTYNMVTEHGLKLTYALLTVCAILMAVYVYNIFKVISNSVALEKVQKEMMALNSKVDSLDSQYLELSSAITPDNLNHYGLQQVKVSSYISRSASLGIATGGHEL